MGHQRSIVHHFFPSYCTSPREKTSKGKVDPLVKTNTKTTSKTSILAHITYI